MKDMLGQPLNIGDTVAFSDAGRGGRVHVGIITEIDTVSTYYGPQASIQDSETNRINMRYLCKILKINKGGLLDANV